MNNNTEGAQFIHSLYPGLYTSNIVSSPELSDLHITKGVWIKYNQGSDHTPLVDSLKGHGTGWYTAVDNTAKIQLTGGDFYVYYSNDKYGEPTIPRVAIRMHDSNIAEIRGIAKDQNLDPFIGDVLQDKLTEFGTQGELYNKKVTDMKKVTEISEKVDSGEPLSNDDLRFLYEIDDLILGFGYYKDPRIKELLQGRNVKEDLSSVLGCRKDQISTTTEEALSGDIKFHYGSLYLNNLRSADGLVLPHSIAGNLRLKSLTSAEGLVLPNSIGGGLVLGGLTSTDGLVLPHSIRGYLDLSGLTSAEGLVLPYSIGGSLDLRGLTSAKGLVLPNSIEGSLLLNGLRSAEGLVFPHSIRGYLELNGLTSAEGLVLPHSIGGDLNLESLKYKEKEILRKRYPQFSII